MNLEIAKRGKYKVIIICDSLHVIEDLAELKAVIEKYLEKGEKYIAVNFSQASYLYSGAISVLITCFKMIRDKGGDLCIVEPQKRLHELLEQMNIDRLITIYDSEEELEKKSSENLRY
ncbi:MAG: STAS domain-containing protein [Chitinivibrionales bacterium]|nr:STAS domain-containing protein [Chitinivibrionales bacterium]